MAERTLTTDPHGEEISIPADAPMPPVEPGHKGHELNPGEVFDPNAARRYAEGREPGLQDSEILQPAHWVQDAPVPEDLPTYLAALERERAMYEQDRDSDRAGQVAKEIARVKAEISKAEKAEKADATKAEA